MTKNLGWKLAIIVGILVLFMFGIFGIPKDLSGPGLLASVTDRIHLGLDLKGGTHLILQVQVNDAVNVDSDNAIARLKEDMRAKKINYAEITKPEPVNHPDLIVIKGVPPDQSSDFKSIVSDRLPEYNPSFGGGELLDHLDEAAEPGGSEESGGGAGHRDHPQPNRPTGRERAGHSGARPRGVPDPGAVAGRGRSRRA